MDFKKQKPHHAVCCEVLNLQTQVGARFRVFALAEAYRVRPKILGSILEVLAQNRMCCITYIAGYISYTIS